MTMNASSFLVAHLGSYFTGAVLMCEHFFHCTASKYRSSAISSVPRHVKGSFILSWSSTGEFDKCCRCIASLKKNK